MGKETKLAKEILFKRMTNFLPWPPRADPMPLRDCPSHYEHSTNPGKEILRVNIKFSLWDVFVYGIFYMAEVGEGVNQILIKYILYISLSQKSSETYSYF